MIFTLSIPFSALVSDNKKFIPLRSGRQTLAPAYRVAKDTLHAQAAAAWPRDPLTHCMALRAVLSPPDRRRRDARNYAKLITDALSGTVYADDFQLVRETWERGPVDRNNPRFVLTLEAAPDPDNTEAPPNDQ